MAETSDIVRLAAEEEPEGLRAALEATQRLLAQQHHQFDGEPQVWLWQWPFLRLYVAKVWVDGERELWQWFPGEPVFTREGGV